MTFPVARAIGGNWMMEALLDILLIEGLQSQQATLVRFLQDAGHRVRAVPFGSEAVRWLTRGNLDLVLLDMDSSDARETLLALRVACSGALTVFVGLAAPALARELGTSLAEVGLQAVVSKPASLGALAPFLSAPEESREPSSLDLDQVSELLSMDPTSGFLAEMAQLFSGRGHELLALIEETHLAQESRGLREAIHELKGASMTIGARALAQACRSAEAQDAPGLEDLLALRAEFLLAEKDIWVAVRRFRGESQPA